MRSRLVTGVSPGRAGNSTLSRLVTRSSRPKTAHVAGGPSASSAASSSAVGAAGRRLQRRPRRRAAGRSERHSRSGSALTSSLVRPLSTDAGWSSASQPSTAYSSCLCSSSHCSLPAASGPGAHQHEPAAQLLAVQVDVQLAVGHGAGRGSSVSCGSQVPGVPHDDVAAAVLAARDHALEVEVLERVVLDVERRPPDRRVEGRTLRHRPADQHAVDLEPEVVVQPAGPVPLHHEPARPARRPGRRWRSPDGSGVRVKSRLRRYGASGSSALPRDREVGTGRVKRAATPTATASLSPNPVAARCRRSQGGR